MDAVNRNLWLHDRIRVLADPRVRFDRISPVQLVHTVSLYRGTCGASLSDLVRYCGGQGLTAEQTIRAARELRDRGLARFTLTS
ncbi:MAG: hypothetical protein JO203_14805 [Gammaproteobacteria bacterium]|nr:hypothetical protein [Gammaproteobacteria bacterium]